MKKGKLRLTRAAGAAITVAGAVGGVVAGAGPAFADVSHATFAAITNPTTVYAGKSAQQAANEVITLPNTFAAGDKISLTVGAPPSPGSAPTNCTANAGSYVDYSSTPTVAVSGPSAATASGTPSTTDTAPVVTATLSHNTAADGSACASLTDVLTLTIGNNATGNSPTDTYTVTVGGIKYNVGSATSTGSVAVGSAYENGTSTAFSTTAAAPSNATVENVAVGANTPGSAVRPTQTAAPISNYTLSESTPGSVTGYVCAVLTGTPSGATTTYAPGNYTATSKPTATATGGGAVVGPVTIVNPTTLAFQVTTPSTTAPATYTVSGIQVDAPNTAAPVNVTFTSGQNSSCTGTSTTAYSPVRAYSVVAQTVTAGATADDTAAALFSAEYPTVQSTSATITTCGNPNAVLATDQNFPDALSGSYVAGQKSTGILLTPTATLSSATQNELRFEGVKTVYVMGGPLAVSDAVVSQLQATPAYNCSTTPGAAPTPTTTNLQVIRIFGQTLYGTAQQAAQYFGATAVGSGNFPGAYGAYNNTTGTQSSAPASTTNGLKTAILATGQGFQDAMTSSAVAYAKQFPVLLTEQGMLAPEAAAAITNMGIQQVILMGGPVAVSNSVVTSLQNMGVSVLRIAGQDYTDTAQQLGQFELNNTSSATGTPVSNGLGWSPTQASGTGTDNATNALVPVDLVRGDFYADGLTGSVVAGNHHQPILEALNPNDLGGSTVTFLNMAGSSSGIGSNHIVVNALNIFGGPLAISSTTIGAAMQAIAQG